ncbi:MAG: hypothetical protein J5594_06055 [Elusimicrobiaceae bacterium]|nr:hypothetical protein [Elusimicrobiaceae bacterium]
MSLNCTEILTSNILENATLSESGNAKTYTFSAQSAINKIIIKNTNLTALTIEYKTSAEGDFSTITATVESCGQDFIFTFPSVINILILKVTFTASGTLNVGKIIAAKTLLTLSEVLSTLSGNIYAREGHHYLANGALVKWKDFTKFNLTLSLENISTTVKQNLENILKNNTFLTYIFYGNFDTTILGEYALAHTPFFSLDRRRALYKTALNLLEK